MIAAATVASTILTSNRAGRYGSGVLKKRDRDETKDAGGGDENDRFGKFPFFVLVGFIFTFLFCHQFDQAVVTSSAVLMRKQAAGKLLGRHQRASVGP